MDCRGALEGSTVFGGSRMKSPAFAHGQAGIQRVAQDLVAKVECAPDSRSREDVAVDELAERRVQGVDLDVHDLGQDVGHEATAR